MKKKNNIKPRFKYYYENVDTFVLQFHEVDVWTEGDQGIWFCWGDTLHDFAYVAYLLDPDYEDEQEYISFLQKCPKVSALIKLDLINYEEIKNAARKRFNEEKEKNQS